MMYFFPLEYLMNIQGIDVLRIYGNVIEEEEFPIPNKVKRVRKTTIHQVPQQLQDISLHHVIRKRSPKATVLKSFEEKFALKKEAEEEVDDETVEAYLKVVLILVHHKLIIIARVSCFHLFAPET